MDKELMVKENEVIVVKQLPIIEDRLEEVYVSVKDRLEAMSNLVVTEDNYKELKKTRADLNKEFGELETLRKQVKSAIEAPYKKFESGAYKRMSDIYRDAIGKLDGEIKDVEGCLKTQKQKELLAYFEEYRQSLGLDSAIADPKRSGIKVGLSGSMKSLKEQVRQYLDRIDGDLKMIDTLDNADEVLAEYRVCMSVTEAVRIVADRHKRIEDEKIRRMAEDENRKAREANEKAVEEAIQEEQKEDEVPVAPTVSVEPEATSEATEPILLCTKYLGYEIFGTLSQLKALKAFLKNELKNYLEREGMKYGEC